MSDDLAPMFRMPVSFGPAPGPRNLPQAHRHRRYEKNTHALVTEMRGITMHLREHHLTPKQVGELAHAAGVKSVVVTHLSAPAMTEALAAEYLREIGEAFPGKALIANDLESF